MDSMRRNAQKMMPNIMAMNKDPNVGMKNNRQPMPGVSNLTAYAKGGKVMAKGGAADKKQDKSMLSRHNRLMHPGQKSKLAKGGMVKKYADGGSVDSSNKLEMRERLKQAEIDSKKIMRDAQVKHDYYSAGQGNKYEEIQKDSKRTPEMRERLKQAEIDSKKIMRDAQDRINNPMNGGMVKKYAEGGKVKKPVPSEPLKPLTPADKKKIKDGINPYPGRSDDMGMKKGGKVKGDKKKVMGTVGEAKALMNAMKKVRRPATPMPGARMAGLGMAPPMAPQMMAPPMKRGGKVMKRAAGRSTKRHTNSKGV